MRHIFKRFAAFVVFMVFSIPAAFAQADDPLQITVGGGDAKPFALAAPKFFAEGAEAQALAAQIRDLALADLVGSGRFRLIDPAAYIDQITDFNADPDYGSWLAINAEALLTGFVRTEPDGRILVQYRLFDPGQAGQVVGLQHFAAPSEFRRLGHKVADAVYSRVTGEGGYFDSRIVYVDESGPKQKRVKRLAIMDQDGANRRYLTDGRDLVLTPRFSPNDQEVLYISYERGEPQIFLLNLSTGQREVLGNFPGMSFAPRFSPDGRQVIMSLSQGGNTDIRKMELATRRMSRLTCGASIDTAPSYSPDGSQIAFESDRGGSQQIYVMSARGGDAQRISFGDGRYATPVWSPRGDKIAFTKLSGGAFQIGVMNIDGSEERILDQSFLSEGPTWSPNGFVLSFFRETPGANGGASLWTVDILGQNLKPLREPGAASDPAWSPLLP